MANNQFGEYEEHIKSFCNIHKLEYGKLASMKTRFGIDFMDIVNNEGEVVMRVNGNVPERYSIEVLKR